MYNLLQNEDIYDDVSMFTTTSSSHWTDTLKRCDDSETSSGIFAFCNKLGFYLFD